MLVGYGVRNRTSGWFGWAALFAYFLFDDMLRLHERFGGIVRGRWDIPAFAGVRSQDLGELVVSGIVAVAMAALITAGYYRADLDHRKSSRALLLLVGLLAFFGVVVDLFHPGSRWAHQTRVVLEDGGEMVAMSLILAFTFGLHLSSPVTDRTDS